MTEIKIEKTIHPNESELASLLDNSLSVKEKEGIREHVATCDECLERIASAHEAASLFQKNRTFKERENPMKKMNLYLILAMISFALSFTMPRYFLQLLVGTLLLGIKWVADSKSTKMLIMIYEAWKKGGEKEASRILEAIEWRSKERF